MNNDLISREALLKVMEEERQYLLARGQTGAEHILVHHCLPLIDNAPAVFSCNACKNMGNERECVDCHDYSNYVHYEERQGEWIPVSERLPEKEGFYLVFLENKQMVVAHSSGIIANHDFDPKMLAWQPLPEPYKEGGVE